MHRELNPPDEILRRFIFIVYLSGWIAAIVLVVLGLAHPNWSFLVYAGLVSLVIFPLKNYGERHLEFKRLASSFPHGAPEDQLPPQLRQEAGKLFKELNATNVDWIQRQELRKELTELIKKNPILLEVYKQEIANVLPALRTRLHS